MMGFFIKFIDENGLLSEFVKEILIYYLKKVNVFCFDEYKVEVVRRVVEEVERKFFSEIKEVLIILGFRIVLNDGLWILIRLSGIEFKIRVVVEVLIEKRRDELFEMVYLIVFRIVKEVEKK